MPTKKEILEETQQIASEYLGHPVQIEGKSWTKERLEQRLKRYCRMIEWKREYEEIRSKYTEQEWIYYSSTGSNPEINRALELRQKANEIWLEKEG